MATRLAAQTEKQKTSWAASSHKELQQKYIEGFSVILWTGAPWGL